MDVRCALTSSRAAELAGFVAAHTTTERVFRDVDRAGLPYDVVPMDEYTLDVVVRLPDGLVLVYDTT